MGKILYIRLDSSPLPEASEDIIVKDFNLESYFCTLFGKRLLEDAGLAGTILYPGKLITDFEKVDEESYKEIIRQWEEVLSYLLIYQSEDDTDFIFKLPDSYIDWLSTCNISLSSLRKNYHTHVSSVFIKRARLFSIVHKTLKNKFFEHIDKFKESKILVVGDIILDEYLWGMTNRRSPEAPVPVLQVKRKTYLLGGAANVANNIAAMGAKAILAGVIGDDLYSGVVLDMLKKSHIDAQFVLKDKI